MFSKHRLEALSDGIFAIVMTLLILDLKVPKDVVPGQLWSALRQEASTWLSFLITFVIAARYWTLQHRYFDLIKRIHGRTLTSTFLFLGLITTLPFSASLLGHYFTNGQAFLVYLLNQAAIGIVMLVEIFIASREDNIEQGESLQILKGRLYVTSGSLFSGMVLAHYLNASYVGISIAIIAVLARRLQMFFHKRYMKKHKLNVAHAK